MNRNVFWTLAAVCVYWMAWGAIGTDAMGTETLRNIVAVGGMIVAFMNVLRYLPNAWEKYHTGATAGEWRMLMGLELFWMGFGAREFYLMGDRMGNWDATGNPLNGFFAFWILCAGLLCFSAASEPIPVPIHQSRYVIALAVIIGMLAGMMGYRMLWG